MDYQQPFAKLIAVIDTNETAIRVACELEATAPKLGNVHPGSGFDDCSYDDFVAAADIVAPVLASDDGNVTLGQRILRAVKQTRTVTNANVNLGIILLIAPLAMCDSQDSVKRLLASLGPGDGRDVFEAIRLASPGGMKREEVKESEDVQATISGPIDLIVAMKSAAERDRIALQYATDFEDFFKRVLPIVRDAVCKQVAATDAVVDAQLRLMAGDPDTLIARKCGDSIAWQAVSGARVCLSKDTPASRQEFDTWLRADGNRRNPGTTADLIAAALYWLLRHPAACDR